MRLALILKNGEFKWLRIPMRGYEKDVIGIFFNHELVTNPHEGL